MGASGPDRVAVGLVGLGLMGAPVAARIYRAGHPLTVYNRTASKAERFAAASGGVARVARRPVDAAAGSRVVITMVADPAALREVTLGPGGILEGAAAGTTLIDMSTVDPETVRALGEAAAGRRSGSTRPRWWRSCSAVPAAPRCWPRGPLESSGGISAPASA